MDGNEPTFSGYPPNCPLADAVPADGAVLRIVGADPPTEADFLSHTERGAPEPSKLTKNQRCRRYSISVYRTMDDAQHHLELFPYEGGLIAQGALVSSMGKTKLCPPGDGSRPSHTEWWKADGVKCLSLFHVVK